MFNLFKRTCYFCKKKRVIIKYTDRVIKNYIVVDYVYNTQKEERFKSIKKGLR